MSYKIISLSLLVTRFLVFGLGSWVLGFWSLILCVPLILTQICAYDNYMANIHFTNTDFDFATLSALTPVSIAGGAHLSKFRVSNNATPFYLQLPKCRTRQGIVKTNGGKKHYCDLVFTHENESFIRWMERLEEFTRKTLFDNREKWFSTELNEHDIDTLFSSPLKVYKAGKCYLLRVNVPSSALKIYDENQCLVSSEEVKEDTQVITVIEIQGVKCSSMSFYLEMEVKQMMVVTPVDQSFELGCVIQKNPAPTLAKPVIADDDKKESNSDNKQENTVQESVAENLKPVAENLKPVAENPDMVDLDVEDIAAPIQEEPEDNSSILEIDIDLDKTASSDVFQIKKRNDVYYEMYREAKRKARLARDLAISSYLEAKRIKTTFLQKDTQDSDLDDDEFSALQVHHSK